VLLVRRATQKYGKTDGVWDVPGGRIDPGTSLLEKRSMYVGFAKEGKVVLFAKENTAHAWVSFEKLAEQNDLDVYLIPNSKNHSEQIT